MRKNRTVILFTAVIAAMAFILSGCQSTLDSLDEEFAFSYGINEDGFWDGIKALKKVDLPEYVGIPIPSGIHTVSEEAIQTEIDGIMENYAMDVLVTGRAVEDGDTISIDYVGSIDGVEFDGGNTMDQGAVVTIGVTSYIDDFLEQLIGHSPGETFDINVTFPADYQDTDLAGQDAVFETTINHIVTTEIPEVTDDFISEAMSGFYGWTTEADMRADIASQIMNASIESYIQQYLIDNSEVRDLPEILIEYQEYSMLEYYRDYAVYYEMEFSDFISAYANVSSAQELIDQNAESSEQTAKMYLIIQAIAEEVGITTTEDDVTAYFSKLMGSENLTGYQSRYGLPHMKMVTIQKAVLDYLLERAVLD